MPDSVDTRVVEMKFDNKNFEQGAKETMSMLDKLREKLSFRGASKGLQDIEAASRNVKLDSIASGVDVISGKFTAMSAVAFTAIQHVVNTAIQAGSQISKSLSLDQIITGFQEYETNMGSIQTILSNTKADGTNLEQVNAALQQLNEYSDKTIYNFGQMARNIGTFTAAGVNLDTSVNSIKGIANLAALSGSNSEQASTAMYQLSQAIATGSVKLMDWNSVVNAGMGGEVFKTALFDTAQAMGTLNSTFSGQTFEEWEAAGNNFRESLQDGWITSDVLTNTLQAFTGDLTDAQLAQIGYTEEQIARMKELGQTGVAAATEVKTITQLIGTVKESIGTGWADSMRIIVGDFEEAKELLTTVNAIIGRAVGNAAEHRNNLLQGWRDLGGREALIQGVGMAVESLGDALDVIKGAWAEVFPPVTAQTLYDLTVRFSNFINSIIPTGPTLEKIGNVFQGVFSAFSIGIEIGRNVFTMFSNLIRTFNEMTGAGSGILDFLSNLGLRLENLEERLVNGRGIDVWFANATDSIQRFMAMIRDSNIGETIDKIKDTFDQLKESLSGLFGEDEQQAADKIADRWTFLGMVVAGFGAALVWVGQKLAEIAEAASHLFGDVIEGIKNSDFDHVTDALNVGILAAMAAGIRKFLKNISEFSPNNFIDKINEAIGELTETLDAMQAKLKSEALLNIAIAIGILAASLLVLSSIDSGDLTKALTATAAGFAELATTMTLLTKIQMGPGGALKIQAIGIALILIAGALVVLSLAIKIMSTMDAGELVKGLTAISIALGVMLTAVNNMPVSGKMISSGIAMIAMAGALIVLSLAVKIFGSMDLKEMFRGLIGVGIALTILVIAVNNLPTSGMIQAGIGITAIALGLVVLSGAVKLMGMMDLKEMFRGLIGIGIALALIVVAVRNMPVNMAVIGAGLVLVGIGLGVVVASVMILGSMPLEQLIVGLAGIAAVLLILAAAAHAMQSGLTGAIAIVVMSGALVILSIALATIAAIGVEGLIISLVALAAAFVILGIAAYILGPMSPALLAVASAMITFGIAIGLLGAGVFLAGAGIWMLIKAVQALVDLVVDSADGVIMVLDLLIDKALEFIKGFIQMFIDMAKQFIEDLPEILSGLGEAFGVIVNEIREVLPDIFNLINELMTEILRLIREKGPDLLATGLFIIQTILDGISQNIESITNKVVDILLSFATTLKERMPELTETGAELLAAFLQGIADNIDTVIEAATNLVVKIIEGITASHDKLLEAGKELVRQIIGGIGEMIQTIIQEGTDLIVDFIVGIGNAADRIVSAGAWTLIKFLEGVTNNILLVITAGKTLALKLIEGVTDNTIDFIDEAAELLINFLNDLETAIRRHSKEIREAGAGVASALLEGMSMGLLGGTSEVATWLVDAGEEVLDKYTSTWKIKSPSREMMERAGYLVEGVVLGVQNASKDAVRDLDSEGSKLMAAFSNSIRSLSTDLEEMEEFNPTITPVLDLTKISSSANDIAGILGGQSVLASSSLGHAGVILEETNRRQTSIDQPENGPSEFNFYQTNNSPKQLSVAEIHRQTKSLLVLAKEELDI